MEVLGVEMEMYKVIAIMASNLVQKELLIAPTSDIQVNDEYDRAIHRARELYARVQGDVNWNLGGGFVIKSKGL